MKVYPKDDKIRGFLKHPSGVGFKEYGPANWPKDAFTLRRLRDGDIVLDYRGQPRAASAGSRATSKKCNAVGQPSGPLGCSQSTSKPRRHGCNRALWAAAR